MLACNNEPYESVETNNSAKELREENGKMIYGII